MAFSGPPHNASRGSGRGTVSGARRISCPVFWAWLAPCQSLPGAACDYVAAGTVLLSKDVRSRLERLRAFSDAHFILRRKWNPFVWGPPPQMLGALEEPLVSTSCFLICLRPGVCSGPWFFLELWAWFNVLLDLAGDLLDRVHCLDVQSMQQESTYRRNVGLAGTGHCTMAGDRSHVQYATTNGSCLLDLIAVNV